VPFDLRTLAEPRRLRIGYDPSYDPAHVPRAKLDPWMLTIPGR
jgi:hypothetical protein